MARPKKSPEDRDLAYALRLPPWLYNYLKQAAEGKQRSMNAEIVERLSGDVRKDGRRLTQEVTN